MTPLAFLKHKGGLIPADDIAQEAFAKLSQGQEVLLDIKARRNVKRHRLAWAIIDLVHRNTMLVPSRENLMDCAKVDLGYVEARSNPFSGECWTVPKSISFATMPEHEFGLFLDGLIDLVLTNWLAGTGQDDLRREVEALVDGPAAIGRRAA